MEQEPFARYDLEACLDNNPQPGFNRHAIAAVLAVHEQAERDDEDDDWRWILRLTDGRAVYLNGNCDYSGWDCRSWAESTITATPEEAAACESVPAVQEDLIRQLREGKAWTWREQTAVDLGLTPSPLVTG